MMKAVVFAFFSTTTICWADPATIEAVTAHKSEDDWRFEVTLGHADTGWDDYADGWRVLDMEGNVLGTRVLHHPHVNEQPFTRSLSGVEIPEHFSQVQIEAKDSIGGWRGDRVTISLDNPSYAR